MQELNCHETMRKKTSLLERQAMDIAVYSVRMIM